jgi:ABC-type branched-subunit amino acid transport system substrate-binding protein
MRYHRNRLASLALLAAVAVVGGACGSSSKSSTPTTSSASPGTSAQATGQPIKVGFADEELGAVSFANVGNGVRAAVDYINAHGGVSGRPIDLDQCLNDGTPQLVGSCASKFASDGDVAVLNGANLTDGPMHTILDAASIPLIGGYPYTAEDIASTTSFWLFPYEDMLASAVKLMSTTFNAKKIGYLMPDVAAAQAPADVMQSVATKLGVGFNISRYSLTSTDFSGPIAELLLDHPNAVLTFCTDGSASIIVKQIRDGGWQGPIVVGTTQAFAQAGTPNATAKDVYALTDEYDWYSTTGVPSQDAKDIGVFLAAMKQYDPSQPLSEFTQQAFGQTMDLYEVLEGLGSNITAQSISQAFRQNVTRHKFMADTFNCATNTLSSVPGNCSAGIQFVWWDGTNWHQSGQFLTATQLLG